MNSHKASLEGAYILVVEDHAKLLRNIAFLLQIAGANVLTAKDSSEAEVLLKNQKADLILSDVDMPNGFELLNHVRASRSFVTPFVAISEKYELHDLMKALDQGASDYLPKPFDAYELMNAVRDNLADPMQRRKAG